ncbi:MAG: ABC transporter permease subunit [Clostridium sp.]|nr:ABC transporter permease subunit [Clostridium sp.]
MILTLVKNELIKTFSKAKTWIIFALFAVFITGMSFVFYKQSKQTEFYMSPEHQLENFNRQKESNNEEIKRLENNNDEKSKEMIASMEASNKSLDMDIAKYEKIVNSSEEERWKMELNLEKEELTANINEGNISESLKEYSEERLEEINKFLDNNEKPIESWMFDGVNFAKGIMKILGMVILAAGIAVFMSDVVSGEATPATFKFLLVQPVSRGKIILSKFISIVITVVGLIGGLEIIAFGVISAIAGAKGGKMPLRIGVEYMWDYNNLTDAGLPTLTQVNGSGIMSTRGTALLQGFLLQILFIIACCAFIFLISAIFNSSMITMAVSVIIPVAVTMSSLISSGVSKIAHLIFFNYGSTVEVITGDIVQAFQNPNITLQFGIVIMCLTIVISYSLAHFIFCKKDILA